MTLPVGYSRHTPAPDTTLLKSHSIASTSRVLSLIYQWWAHYLQWPSLTWVLCCTHIIDGKCLFITEGKCLILCLHLVDKKNQFVQDMVVLDQEVSHVERGALCQSPQGIFTHDNMVHWRASGEANDFFLASIFLSHQQQVFTS